MSIRRAALRAGKSLAGVGATVGLATSGLRHVGWWLDWHTRGTPGHASRPLDEAGPPADGKRAE